MRALTVWQPWASLIAVGAKSYEFRGWDFTRRSGGVPKIGERIAIHAGARPVHPPEVLDVLARIDAHESALNEDLARPLLERLRDAHRAQLKTILPLSAIVATAAIGKPMSVTAMYPDYDSDRLDHSKFGWPLTDVVRLDVPVPSRGAQGFWHFPEALLQ